MLKTDTRIEGPDVGSDGEVALTPRQQSALQSGLHALSVSSVSIDFNQRLLGALLSGQDRRSWHEQIGTRLRWMLPAVLLGCGVTLSLAYRQNLVHQIAVDKPAFTGFSTATPPPLPPMPARFMDAWQTESALRPAKKESHDESR